MTIPEPADHERRSEGERRKTAPWLRLDAAFMADEKVIDLGELHGAAGPLSFVAIMGAAKLQDEDGQVRMGWRQLARAAFVADQDVRAILATAEALGLVIVKARDEWSFTAEIVNWSQFQRPADRTAAARKRRERERKTEETSHPVTRDTTVTARDRAATSPLSRTDRDKDKDSSGEHVEQQVAPAAAGALHPAFADVMAIAQEVCGKDSTLQPPVDFAIERTLRAYPHADHLAAANLAAADLLSRRRTTRHFEKVLADNLADQTKTPRAVDRRSEREQRGAADLAALRSLRGEANVD